MILINLVKVIEFNSVWKKERPLPVDMAAFAVNVTLILSMHDAEFSYNSALGYQVCFFDKKFAYCFKIL